MKYLVAGEQPNEKPEPKVFFKLVQLDNNSVGLIVMSETGSTQYILSIGENGIRLYPGVSDWFGLPTEKDNFVKVWPGKI